jgi:hypothetical protein
LIDAFSRSLHSVFLWAIPFAACAFLLTLLLREIPLRGRQAPGVAAAEDFGMPLNEESASASVAGSRVRSG